MDQFQERLTLGEALSLVKVVELEMLLPLEEYQEEAQDRGVQDIAIDLSASLWESCPSRA